MAESRQVANTKLVYFRVLFIGLIVGLAAGAALYQFFSPAAQHSQMAATTAAEQEEKPLYWVAPMDDNYRRDKPGKSPMGMDLVPVYASDVGEDSPGTVSISPTVENNLGVRTARAIQAPLTQQIEAFGTVNYNQDEIVHIHPRIAGWVEKLHIKSVGDPVQKGQVLYELYSPELVNAQEEYVLTLAGQQAELIQAAERKLRALLIPEHTIMQIKKTRKVSNTIAFVAPQTGVVEKLNIREGYYVELGTTMLSIVDLSQVWVEAQIFERYAAYINAGDKVEVKIDNLPTQKMQGEISYIYPTLNQSQRTLAARIRIANDQGKLKPGMFARIYLDKHLREQSILVPKEAVIDTGMQKRVVLARSGGKFRSVAVKTGHQNQQYIEVLSGVNKGDNVVVSAQFLLDSESSKNSDFVRMYQGEPVKSATVTGTLNSLDKTTGVANIARGPIVKWDRPPMTMDFIVRPHLYEVLATISGEFEFTFEIQGDDFVVVDIVAPLVSPKHEAAQPMSHNPSAHQH